MNSRQIAIITALAAILAAREHGAKHDAIQHVIDHYRGMPHRLEYVRKVGGVEFYLMEQEGSRYSEFESAKRCLDTYRSMRKST